MKTSASSAKSSVPEEDLVLTSVWKMKRKKEICTRKIEKYKAHLNNDGSKMKPGLQYYQTYYPVSNWN